MRGTALSQTLDGECQWTRPEQQSLFNLGPLRVRGNSLDDVLAGGARRLRKGGQSQWVLLASFNGEALVERRHGSAEWAARGAEELARKTGDPVVVGRQVGVDGTGSPVFQAVGQVLTEKADPLSPRAFSAWASSLTAKILRASRGDLQVMAVEALEYLDIDFAGATAQQLDSALLGYRTTIASPTQTMARVQRLEITKTLERVIRSTGRHVQSLPEVRAGLGTGFSINDRVTSNLLSRHHSFWVRDRHGAISETMSAQARKIISSGVRRGLGPDEIARELRGMTATGLRQEHYYRTVAANHVARGRSYSTGATMRAAGVTAYRIEAILDDRTTHQCEFLHQKILPVAPGVAAIERTMRDPDPQSVLINQPFIVDRGDHLAVPTPGGGMARVATIDQRSTGGTASGQPSAQFSNGMSSSDLVSHAIGFPPYHHNCRTTTVAL